MPKRNVGMKVLTQFFNFCRCNLPHSENPATFSYANQVFDICKLRREGLGLCLPKAHSWIPKTLEVIKSLCPVRLVAPSVARPGRRCRGRVRPHSARPVKRPPPRPEAAPQQHRKERTAASSFTMFAAKVGLMMYGLYQISTLHRPL